MTSEQTALVHKLRLELLRMGYPPIVVVDNATLEAVEEYTLEHLKKLNYPEILLCGNNGLLFKGCELVLKA